MSDLAYGGPYTQGGTFRIDNGDMNDCGVANVRSATLDNLKMRATSDTSGGRTYVAIDMAGRSVTNLGAPTLSSDAATLATVQSPGDIVPHAVTLSGTDSKSTLNLNNRQVINAPDAVTDDNLVSKGFLQRNTGFLAPASFATTANLDGTASGANGSTLTANANGFLAVDGADTQSSPAQFAVGTRLLLRAQTVNAQNGVYVIVSAGSVSTPWVLQRSNDQDTASKFVVGVQIFVTSGTANAGTIWYLNSVVTTLGTDGVSYTGVSTGGGGGGGGGSGSFTTLSVANLAVQQITNQAQIVSGAGTLSLAYSDYWFSNVSPTTNPLPDGTTQGMQFNPMNINTGATTVTGTFWAANRVASSSITLAPGASYMFLWNGTAWQPRNSLVQFN